MKLHYCVTLSIIERNKNNDLQDQKRSSNGQSSQRYSATHGMGLLDWELHYIPHQHIFQCLALHHTTNNIRINCKEGSDVFFKFYFILHVMETKAVQNFQIIYVYVMFSSMLWK